ncbi:MAG: hypothetical protein CMP49_01420 [Flavobacteriales bacterium]|jgi:hypothetical protein|nr:hypothetical protein [Flavobacteriales bacterium]|tara:strand:+ start:4250 stop:5071 length:822 start_codon:yes stop_codon:yes gene_type:complete
MSEHIYIIFTLLLFSICLYSQEQVTNYHNKELSLLSNKILTGDSDSIREEASKKLNNYFLKMLNEKKSYLYQLENTENIYIIQPKDRKFKLITWFLPYLNGTYKYFGIIQKCNKKGRKCNIYMLENRVELTQNDNNKIIDCNNWYGSIYYDIVPIKVGKNRYYTLLGWDGNNSNTSKKIIEVLNIKRKKDPVFGANIFNNSNTRILLEYSSQYPISLKYDAQLEYIVFDHLEPIDGISIDNFNLYATDLSYDILKKSKIGWKLEENIYLNNLK